ncbi:energy transducer TonB [Lysobacter sp. KIS68-7]|uniref:energy transducer TonB n=1 Tax=Lysobacter sp. KIS68-7 TaxID=2904252 RepID=UPI001E61A36A|nr:energy transducer TonB [Lysobacter sp. KIS68-7]UHQ20706.1 energy transducer TonB [Lysobacter sp. KIS68-7]
MHARTLAIMAARLETDFDMRSVLVSALLFFSVPATATSTKPGEIEQLMTLRVDGEIEVDKTGRVSSYQAETPLPEEFAAIVDKAVAGWTFHPPVLNGKPATARAKVRITLASRQEQDQHHVWVDDVSFPAQKVSEREGRVSVEVPASNYRVVESAPKPRYPTFAVGALVSLDARVDSSGRVIDAAATQCRVHAIQADMPVSRACKTLEREAIRAAKQWTLAYEGRDGGTADLRHVSINLQYAVPHLDVSSDHAPGVWRPESRTAYRDSPWQSENRIGVADVHSHGLPRAPVLDLRTGIIEEAL